MKAKGVAGIGALLWLALVVLAIVTHGDLDHKSAAAAVPATPAPSAAATTTAPPPTTTAAAPAAPETVTAKAEAGKITLTGTVPDQSSHDALVQQAVTAFGQDNVVDQLNVSADVAPATWSSGLPGLVALLAKDFKGSVTGDATAVAVTGVASNAAIKKGLLDAAATAAGSGVQVIDKVTVVAPRPAPAPAAVQRSLDKVLRTANVQFETNRADLTAAGKATLDRIVPILKSAPKVAIDIAGYTDASGSPAANLVLSQLRAQRVRDYLVVHGIAARRLTAHGFGQANPVATNATPAGRALNRRIEMHVKKG